MYYLSIPPRTEEDVKVLFKNIETERVILKNIGIDDREFIFSEFSDENERSIRLAEKLGFVLSGSSSELFRDKEHLHNRYSLHVTRFE